MSSKLPPRPQPFSDESPTDDILDAIAEAQDAGTVPNAKELMARFSGHERRVRRLLTVAGHQASISPRPGSGPLAALPPGTQLGDFVIERLHAIGGNGGVYLARQCSLRNRAVALKVVQFGSITHSGGSASRMRVARFEREVEQASRLHHPCLAEVYGSGEANGVRFYAMRFVEGPTLHSVLERLAAEPARGHRPTVRRHVVARVAEIAQALAVVHAAGLVHRDVKPSNVVLEGEGAPAAGLTAERTGRTRDGADQIVPDRQAVLVDFGLVRPVERRDLTVTSGLVGTAAYAAPEAFIEPGVGPTADVFSLGVTLHDLLVCRLPHERRGTASHLEPLADVMPGIDRNLAAIVDMATRVAADRRYPDGGALADDLCAWLADEPVSARRMPVLERAGFYVRQHPARALAWGWAAVVAVALLAGATTWVLQLQATSKALQEAHAGGDIVALNDLLDSLSGEWLSSPEDRKIQRRIADPKDPLASVHAYLESRQPEEALSVAFARLAVLNDSQKGDSGLAEEPLLASWLERLVRTPSAERGEALRLLARFFVEERDLSPRAWTASTGLRHSLLAFVTSEPDSIDGTAAATRLSADNKATVAWDEQKLNALTALQGCGDVDQLPALLAWRAEHSILQEEWRLATLACVCILLRAQQVERLEEGPSAAFLLTETISQTVAVAAQPFSINHRRRLDAELVLDQTVLIHARRRRESIPAKLIEKAIDLAPDAVSDATLSAAAGPPWWDSSQPPPRLADSALNHASHWVGCLQWAMADAAAVERAKIRCLEELVDVDLGGLSPATWFADRVEERRRYSTGGLAALDPVSRLDYRGPLHAYVADMMQLMGSAPSVAGWDFSEEGFDTCSGWALDATFIGAARRGIYAGPTSEHAYVRLRSPGNSAASFRFAVPRLRQSTELELRITCMVGSRQQFPFDAGAHLRILLDGHELTPRVRAGTTDWGQIVVGLGNTTTPQGEHELTIELLEATSSPLWLQRVEVCER